MTMKCSCAELDTLVAISRDIEGVHGCRMTGGGFGGCAVALIEGTAADRIMSEFRQQYLQAAGHDPVMLSSPVPLKERI